MTDQDCSLHNRYCKMSEWIGEIREFKRVMLKRMDNQDEKLEELSNFKVSLLAKSQVRATLISSVAVAISAALSIVTIIMKVKG